MPLSKKTHRLILEEANLALYPSTDPVLLPDPENQLTLGDLHGNALKLIYFLMRHHVIKISEENYYIFTKIYEKDIEVLNNIDIANFCQILAEAEVNPNAGTVRLLGDELADRGNNDYYTLKILELLHKKKVPLEILLSNHSIEFIRAYETNKPFLSATFGELFARSMHHLNSMIEKKLISREEIISLIDTCYKPHLKCLSCTLDPLNNHITLYSHAPIELGAIHSIALKLDVPYQDNSIYELSTTIDHINAAFSAVIANNQIHLLFSPKAMQSYDYFTEPFVFLVWNREWTLLNRPSSLNLFGLFFVHGHTATDHQADHIVNLDQHNTLGHAHTENKGMIGKYSMLYSQENGISKKNTPQPFIAEDNKSNQDALDEPSETTSLLSSHEEKTILPIFEKKHPQIWRLLKWGIIPGTIAGVMLFSGALNAVPVIHPLLIQLSMVLVKATGISKSLSYTITAFCFATGTLSILGNRLSDYIQQFYPISLKNHPSSAPTIKTEKAITPQNSTALIFNNVKNGASLSFPFFFEQDKNDTLPSSQQHNFSKPSSSYFLKHFRKPDNLANALPTHLSEIKIHLR